MQLTPNLVIRFAALVLVLCAPSHGSAQVNSGEQDVPPASPNTLTAAERSAGWQLLFSITTSPISSSGSTS
jgi:hypothetical protein